MEHCIELVSFPIQHGDFPLRYVTIYQMATPWGFKMLRQISAFQALLSYLPSPAVVPGLLAKLRCHRWEVPEVETWGAGVTRW